MAPTEKGMGQYSLSLKELNGVSSPTLELQLERLWQERWVLSQQCRAVELGRHVEKASLRDVLKAWQRASIVRCQRGHAIAGVADALARGRTRVRLLRAFVKWQWLVNGSNQETFEQQGLPCNAGHAELSASRVCEQVAGLAWRSQSRLWMSCAFGRWRRTLQETKPVHTFAGTCARLRKAIVIHMAFCAWREGLNHAKMFTRCAQAQSKRRGAAMRIASTSDTASNLLSMMSAFNSWRHCCQSRKLKLISEKYELMAANIAQGKELVASVAWNFSQALHVRTMLSAWRRMVHSNVVCQNRDRYAELARSVCNVRASLCSSALLMSAFCAWRHEHLQACLEDMAGACLEERLKMSQSARCVLTTACKSQRILVLRSTWTSWRLGVSQDSSHISNKCAAGAQIHNRSRSIPSPSGAIINRLLAREGRAVLRHLAASAWAAWRDMAWDSQLAQVEVCVQECSARAWSARSITVATLESLQRSDLQVIVTAWKHVLLCTKLADVEVQAAANARRRQGRASAVMTLDGYREGSVKGMLYLTRFVSAWSDLVHAKRSEFSTTHSRKSRNMNEQARLTLTTAREKLSTLAGRARLGGR